MPVNLYNLDPAGKPSRAGLCTSAKLPVVRTVQSPNKYRVQRGQDSPVSEV